MRPIKSIITVLLLFASYLESNAQNPFEKYGYHTEPLTLSKGKYIEFFDTDTIAIIGNAVYDWKNKNLVGFIKSDTVYSEATLEPELISRWYSPDPLFQEREWLSPYNFVQNSPIIRIDPNGALDDDYKVDKEGKISFLRKTNDDFDVLYNENESKSVQVDKGILDNVKQGKDSKGNEYDYMKAKDNETATNLFEFVAEETQVEWSQVKYGTESNYISTGHDPISEPGGADLMYGLLIDNYTVREHIHSHPNRKSSHHGPSGFHPKDKNSGDKELAEWLHKYYPSKGVKLKVYEVPIKKYIEYDHKRVK